MGYVLSRGRLGFDVKMGYVLLVVVAFHTCVAGGKPHPRVGSFDRATGNRYFEWILVNSTLPQWKLLVENYHKNSRESGGPATECRTTDNTGW